MVEIEAERPKAYSYIRFSTPEQARGESFRRQSDKASEYAALHRLDLADDRYMDQGVSAFRGKNREFGALADFLQAVEAGVVEKGSYLLVESMDRISREKPRKAARLLEDICDAGIILVTLSDKKVYSSEIMDADPMAFMFAYMSAIRANEESELKAKRVGDAWAKKKKDAAESGKPMTKRLPGWLQLTADRKAHVLREDRASIVRRIFKEADEGLGQHTIAARLNEGGVPVFGEGGLKGAFWQRSYIKKILQNPAVIGTFIPHVRGEVNGKRVIKPLDPIPGFFPAVIKKPVFDRIQARLASKATPRMRAAKGEVSNILAGIARCPTCGHTMTRVNKGRKGGTPYLVCTKAKSGAGCDYRQVKITMVEAAIRYASARTNADGETVTGRLLNEVPTGDEGLDDLLRDAQRNWEGVSVQIDNLAEEIGEGNTSPALRRKLAAAEAELETVEATIAELEGRQKVSSGRAIKRVVSRLEDTFADPRSTVTACNVALRDAFNSCTVDYRTGELVFAWKQGGETSIPYDMVD